MSAVAGDRRGWREALARFAPDARAVWVRFPFPLSLFALAAVLLVILANDVIDDRGEFWTTAMFGCAFAAVLSAGGIVRREIAPLRRRWVEVGTIYVLPLAVLLAMLPLNEDWIAPYLVAPSAVLWASVMPFLGTSATRAEGQARFWSFNVWALTTAAVAAGGFLVIALGVVALERSLAILFGVDGADIFYRFVLPVLGGFFTPAFWLASLPRPAVMEPPAVLVRVASLLGQFVLVPLLLAYAAVLSAYAVQIAISGQWPQGIIAWMVLGFAITGTATYLLLYPSLRTGNGFTRFFGRVWFWLTPVPLALFATALAIRVSAYGLTPQRILLLAALVWAAGVTVAFLMRRGDIRLVPGLAALVLTLFALWPLHPERAALWDQARRLEAALAVAADVAPDAEEEAEIGSALAYLVYSDRDGIAEVQAIAGRLDLPLASTTQPHLILQGWGIDPRTETWQMQARFERGHEPIDLSATPIHLTRFSLMAGRPSAQGDGVVLTLEPEALTLAAGGERATLPLGEWMAEQSGPLIADPVWRLSAGGVDYALVIDSVGWEEHGPEGATLTYADGLLFASAVPAPAESADRAAGQP